jgi:energy-coupling factor transport system substrate-specific component
VKAIFPLLLKGALYGLSMAIGLLAFIYPFLAPLSPGILMGQAHARDAPLLLTLLVGLCFLVLLLEVQGQIVNAKFVALLGVLVSINAVLRFVEVAIPAPGGFSPIFPLIVLTGYVFGGRFGFLMGALTLLVSALITGTIGPWLPYQMFTAGWVGMSAPLCRPVVHLVSRAITLCRCPAEGRTRRALIVELATLCAFSALWGLLYGAIINVWFWPFAVGPANQQWTPGSGVLEALEQYAAFYLATSLVWDSIRGIGNVLLLLAFGAPALRALRRFRRRFAFSYDPIRAPEALAQAR